MKGRFFPTYEYRLFIRDRRQQRSNPPESAGNDEPQPLRRDTVLMTAKNRGKKHQDVSGVIVSPSSTKKGTNNYYLQTPRQLDVDNHYKSINPDREISGMANGTSTESSPLLTEGPPVLLGRLQSNFIGTEFQIFTPSLKKRPPRTVPPSTARLGNPISSDSESDFDCDNASGSEAPSLSLSRRSSRFRRGRSKSRKFKQGRDNGKNSSNNNNTTDEHPQSIEEDTSLSPPPDRRKLRRSYSLPALRRSSRSRSSRRAVANAGETQESSEMPVPLLEEEDGAITYTANLLGNRPRIMDVCVPRVSPEGIGGAEWKRYIESTDAVSGDGNNRMLTHFRLLQQRIDNPQQQQQPQQNQQQQNQAVQHNQQQQQQQQQTTDQGNGADNPHQEGDATATYVAPDDFGLLALQNRPPWWNVELGAFVLNFGGRVSVASVKNFQLCDRNDHNYIMLQFGRIQGRHSFTMDFRYPLTAVQAFAIAISSLQSRISFG